MPMIHSYGHRADPKNHGMPSAELLSHKFSRSAAFPSKFSLRQYVINGPGILDQTETSSCVGHGIDGAIETRLSFLGAPIPHKSPLGIYDIARCMERADEYQDTPVDQLPALTDNGAIPSYGWKGLATWGVPSYNQRPTDVAEVNNGPFLGQLEDSVSFKLDGAYRIEATGSGLIQAFQQAVFSGFPVTLAIQVDQAFENWGNNYNSSNPPVTAPNPNRILGGHYIYGIGWETVNGKFIVECVNSWNTDWGDDGCLWGDGSFLDQSTDLYVADVHQTS